MTIVVTPGERHEATAFERLMAQGAVRRPGRGRPKRRPKRVVGDKGYSSRKIRAYLRRRGIRMTIPRKRNERRTGPFRRFRRSTQGPGTTRPRRPDGPLPHAGRRAVCYTADALRTNDRPG